MDGYNINALSICKETTNEPEHWKCLIKAHIKITKDTEHFVYDLNPNFVKHLP